MMKMKTMWAAGSLFAALAIALPVAADSNQALDDWKAFAAKSGNPDHAKWVKEISKPEAIALAKQWKDLRGYDAHGLIEKEKIPADLKPGLKITKANAAQYPWLAKYLPKEIYNGLTGADAYIGEISIVPTNTYYMHAGVLAATKNMKAKGIQPKINQKGELVNPDGSFTLINDATASAIPFLHPKNGQELNWLYVAHSVATDDLFFNPIVMTACTPQGVVDRRYKANMWWQKFHGRDTEGVKGSVPGKEQFIEGGSVFFLEPYDVRGLAGVRQRYPEGGKADDFKVFIPSLRRPRLLTGSDAQDPLASGLELTWDDWRAYWAKTDIDTFDYKLAGEGFVLASPEVGYVYDSMKLDSSQCKIKSMEVELRPVWILETTDKSGKYQYSKRTTWIDKEFYYMQYHMTWDPRGNAYRNWDDSRSWRPYDGRAQWRFVTIYNNISKRFNTLYTTPQWKDIPKHVTAREFNVDQLRDYQ